jgi:hypothetical protein
MRMRASLTMSLKPTKKMKMSGKTNWKTKAIGDAIVSLVFYALFCRKSASFFPKNAIPTHVSSSPFPAPGNEIFSGPVHCR